ncbi:MAG: hypothetical protein AAFY30_14075 [Cyanobacteria bacterium J06642_12]
MLVRKSLRNSLLGIFLASATSCSTQPPPHAIAPNTTRNSASSPSVSDRAKLLYNGDPNNVTAFDMALALARYNLPSEAVAPPSPIPTLAPTPPPPSSPSPLPTPIPSPSPSPTTSPSPSPPPLLALVGTAEDSTSSSIAAAAGHLLGQPIENSLDRIPNDGEFDFAAPAEAIDLADIAVIAAAAQLSESDRSLNTLQRYANHLLGAEKIADGGILRTPGSLPPISSPTPIGTPMPSPTPSSSPDPTPIPSPTPPSTPTPTDTPRPRDTPDPFPPPTPIPTPIPTFDPFPPPTPIPTFNPFPPPTPIPTFNPLPPPTPPQICSQRVGPFVTQSTATQRRSQAQFQGYEVSGVFPCFGQGGRGYCFNVFGPCSGGSNPPPGGGVPPSDPCDNPLVPSSLC